MIKIEKNNLPELETVIIDDDIEIIRLSEKIISIRSKNNLLYVIPQTSNKIYVEAK